MNDDEQTPPKQGQEETSTQSNEAAGQPGRRGRPPIPIQWHHSKFDLTVVSVQAMVAGVTMAVALVGAFFIHDEYQDRRQARMTRAWSLLNETREIRFYNVGQIEALQSLHLSGANMRRMSMESRFLQGIDLRGADLLGSHFSASNLSFADLRNADLSQTRLDVSNLSEAWLDDANISEAVVSRAKLGEASLRGADLSGAILAGADLKGADLTDAKLAGTDLSNADLTDVRGLDAERLAKACADEDKPPTLPEGLLPPPVCE